MNYRFCFYSALYSGNNNFVEKSTINTFRSLLHLKYQKYIFNNFLSFFYLPFVYWLPVAVKKNRFFGK